MTTVSVIIAAHNAQLTIERAINSARGQTLRLIEILVIDDNSADATANVVTRCSIDDPRVRLISTNRNLGPGFARNLAISQARGEWIAILDADDAYAPDRLKHLIAFAELSGADLVSDNLLVCKPDGGNTGATLFPPRWLPVDKPLDAEAFVLGNIGERGKARLAYGFMKPVIKREFLKRHNIKYEISRFAEDYVLALHCLIAGAKWCVLPEALYWYTMGNDTLTNKRSEVDMQALIDAEGAVMVIPSVLSDIRLHAAISHHLINTRKAMIWNAFAQSLKRYDLMAVVRLGYRYPQFIHHLVKETLWLAFDILRRPMKRKLPLARLS